MIVSQRDELSTPLLLFEGCSCVRMHTLYKHQTTSMSRRDVFTTDRSNQSKPESNLSSSALKSTLLWWIDSARLISWMAQSGVTQSQCQDPGKYFQCQFNMNMKVVSWKMLAPGMGFTSLYNAKIILQCTSCSLSCPWTALDREPGSKHAGRSLAAPLSTES